MKFQKIKFPENIREVTILEMKLKQELRERNIELPKNVQYWALDKLCDFCEENGIPVRFNFKETEK